LTTDDKQAAFSVLAFVTFTVVVGLAIVAPWIATTYGEPILIPYLRLICVCACIELIAMPILGLLQREMAFGKVAIITTFQVSVGAVVTIACAAVGLSSMSFAWGWFASAAAGTATALYLWPDHSIFRLIAGGWRSVLIFGGYYGANQMLARFYESVPSLVLGRTSSMDAVGLYNRALTICQLPDKVFLSGVVAVAVPAFSAMKRDNSSLKGPYLRGLSYITALQWPALAALAILAYPIVSVLLGPQWKESATLIPIIAMALLFSFTFELNFPVLVAIGAMRDLFIRAMIVWPVSAVILSVGAYFGLKPMAFSLLFVIPFQAYIAILAVRKHIEMSWHEIFLPLWKSLIVTLFTATGPLTVVAFAGFRFELSVIEGAIGGQLAAIGWLIGLWLTKHALLTELLSLIALLRNFRAGQLPLNRSPRTKYK
jgi:O-antigen/teichoic acid export membrane protein